jgi:hypothetical protein
MAAMRKKSSRHRSRSTRPLNCARARKGSRREWLYGNYCARGVGSRVLWGIGPAQEHKMHDKYRHMATKASGVLKEDLKILFNLGARCRRAQSFVLASRAEWNKFPSLRLQFVPEVA